MDNFVIRSAALTPSCCPSASGYGSLPGSPSPSSPGSSPPSLAALPSSSSSSTLTDPSQLGVESQWADLVEQRMPIEIDDESEIDETPDLDVMELDSGTPPAIQVAGRKALSKQATINYAIHANSKDTPGGKRAINPKSLPPGYTPSFLRRRRSRRSYVWTFGSPVKNRNGRDCWCCNLCRLSFTI